MQPLMPAPPSTGSAVRLAMIGAAGVIAQFVAGKAARDALFLARFDITQLPLMVMAASVFSIACALAMSRAMSRVPPVRLLPFAFVASGGLIVLEWLLGTAYPRAGAVVFYLHMLGLAPVLVSGFWTILSERFDPRTAKRRLGHIGAAGTFGGVAGGLIADRVAVWSTASGLLPVLAVMNLACAWAVWRLASRREGQVLSGVHRMAPVAPSGLVVVARNAHLRNLAALVLLTTLGATLVDYVFKARAVGEIGRGDVLLRFFALYYGTTSVLTFLAQVTLSRPVLERLGLAPAVGAPSLAVVAGGLGALFIPGLPPAAAARGSEYVSRMSLFRSAYELLYTPVSARDKRAAKPIIDVGFDRTGDLLGASLTRVVIGVAPAAGHSVILAVALASALAALVVARRVTRGYIQTLERSLLDQAVRLDLSEVEDLTTRETIVRTTTRVPSLSALALPRPAVSAAPAAPAPAAAPRDVADPVVQSILALRSRDRDQVLEVLRRDQGPDRVLVPHVIPLLAWDAVAPDAIVALRKVAEEALGQLVDSMLDPRQDFAIRRRIARVLSICVSQRAVDGLMLALDDRFEVRFQAGRSLAAIAERSSLVRIDPDRIYQVVLREVSVGRPVWESHRLLDAVEEGDGSFFVDRFIRERAGQSMAHVFTLLSLVLHREPLQIAFRGLHVADRLLRGTALEYLESVLPPEIRSRLWPFLEDSRPSGRTRRTRDEIVADLVRSNDSIMLNLAELERRADEAHAGPAEGTERVGVRR
jgi:AAA family ATP:ADP antiporter